MSELTLTRILQCIIQVTEYGFFLQFCLQGVLYLSGKNNMYGYAGSVVVCATMLHARKSSVRFQMRSFYQFT
jgi:hypothetical protein